VETFIVRLWAPEPSPEPGSPIPTRGFVRHVGSGRETSFGSWDELRALLDSTEGALLDQGAAAAPEPAAG
jgi:hypothetical protein